MTDLGMVDYIHQSVKGEDASDHGQDETLLQGADHSDHARDEIDKAEVNDGRGSAN